MGWRFENPGLAFSCMEKKGKGILEYNRPWRDT